MPTNAFTETPILPASSSKIFDKALSNLNDLVTVAERASPVKFGVILTQSDYFRFTVIKSFWMHDRVFKITK
jgi:hypothetical protein